MGNNKVVEMKLVSTTGGRKSVKSLQRDVVRQEAGYSGLLERDKRLKYYEMQFSRLLLVMQETSFAPQMELRDTDPVVIDVTIGTLVRILRRLKDAQFDPL